ncbi:MAG: hypothetical protein K2L72_04760 [Clostridia bacterium]|nr:hypothetical protein [Clostridia bacterium]
MQAVILAWTGYWIGIGIELGIIVISGVVLALLLTGILFRWIVIIKEKLAVSKAERQKAAAERALERQRQREAAEAAAEAAAAEAAAAELAAAEAAEAEEVAEEEAEVAEEKQPEASAAAALAEEPVANEEAAVEEEPKAAAKKSGSKKKGSKKVEESEAEQAVGEPGAEVVYVQGDGVVFNESKTITELYEELSAEQKSYFDELREEALTKPDSELSISRNFVSVKIGKRNLIKLLIKRGVTVAEFMLENEQLKQLRLSDKNKRGKSTIKVKPTVVQVLDLPSLKVAVDMINLAYEELMLDD